MPKNTVLVTGATGYIAKHLVLQLLNAGYAVVGSTRSLARAAELQEAVAPHLDDPTALERLRVVALDLTGDEGWDAAMQGVDVLMHTASPFPMTQPKNEDDVIRPAVDGALRAVKAARAAGITRVIMTSSAVAIFTGDLPAGKSVYDETDWSDPDSHAATPYAKSKTLAERAVWDWQASEAPEMQITMINPVFVQGAPLDSHFGTSIQVIERLLKGKDPMQPRLGMPCVDVRDIALMHIRAMERDDSIGKRFVGAGQFLWFTDMARLLKKAYPMRRIATRTAPDILIRFMAMFDPAIRGILPDLGRRIDVSNARARDILGIEFRETDAAVRAAGDYLVDNNLV
jgi:nucleoside-diphosphate-sugar epimerase